MTVVKVPGFKQLNTSSNPRELDPMEVTEALNMVWTSNRLKGRDGSTLFKSNSQWPNNYIIQFTDFKKRDDAFFYTIVALDDGRLFYIRSDNASYGTSTATFTEITSTTGSSPALATATEVNFFGFNDKLFVANRSNGYYYFNTATNRLVKPTNPTNLSTANIVCFLDKTSRLVALDDNGRTHLSIINDGTDFTGTGSGSLNYARVEGLKATSMAPYGDDILITTEDPLTLKFLTYYLSGIQFYDPAVAGSDRDQFQVKKINSIAGMVGRTAEEIADDTIGITPRGFIGVSKVVSNLILTERDFLSFPIKEIIQQINFTQATSFSSTVDYTNGHYICAVPYGQDTEFANILLVYDFLRSSPAEGIYRWSIWTFPYGDISLVNKIAGAPYLADTDGNLYRINDPNSSFDDEGEAINYVLKTSAFGGQDLDTEKDYSRLVVLFTDLSDNLTDMTVNSIINGSLINEDIDGSPMSLISIDLPGGGLLYDTPGLLYDDFKFYDSSGSDQRVVTFSNRGGRADSMQWIFSTNSTGVNWGIGGLWSYIDPVDMTDESGVNNSGDV